MGEPTRAKDCPNPSVHGNPFRYCPYCEWTEERPRVNPLHDLRRKVTELGGKNDSTESRYDHEREGRVIVFTVFFPDASGYPRPNDG